MFVKAFKNYLLSDKNLKESERLLKESDAIKKAAENWKESIELEMLQKLNEMQSKIDFHVARVAELEQKVKIYEELILKFNLFEKK